METCKQRKPARTNLHTHKFYHCIKRKKIPLCLSPMTQTHSQKKHEKKLNSAILLYLLQFNYRHSGTAGNTASNEKPFACPVPGCKKRYKNVNGIKYHSKNGHKKEGK